MRDEQGQLRYNCTNILVHHIFLREQAMRSEQKLSAESKLSSVCLAYLGSVLCCANILAQAQLPFGRSGFSSHYSFPVDTAFWLFQHSGSSGFLVVTSFLRSLRSLKTTKILKGEKNQIIRRTLPIVKETAY